MSYGVTPTGFVRPTLAELKAEIDAQAAAIWPGIDTDGDGQYGQLIGLCLKLAADAWDAAQEIYTSRNVNEATGASLDNIFAERGIIRIDASPTEVPGVLLWGDDGTLIPAGSLVRQSSTKQDAYLQSDTTITAANLRAVELELATPSGSTTYSVVLDGTTYTATSTSRDTAGASLVSSINGGSLGATASYSAGVLTVDGTVGIEDSVDFALGALTNISVADDGLAAAGTFLFVNEGPLPCPIGTLDTIQTPISGWAIVENTQAGATGRNAETDSEFRIRGAGYYSIGKATQDAIRQNVLNTVDGVVACSVTSNRDMTTDSDGRPAKSFEVLVEGGAAADIRRAIWEATPAGIEIYGTVSGTVTDSEGRTQTVKFTRPTYAYIWVKVRRSLNTEDTYPVDGDATIKANIVAWALANYNAGDNVYRRALMTPINSVPGLADVVILLGDTTDGSTPSTYSAVDLSIGATVLPAFDTARIIVETL